MLAVQESIFEIVLARNRCDEVSGMTKADGARVSWDAQKKHWSVRIQVGGEVIKRPCPKASQGMDEQALREMAIQTARDDGYELDPSRVAIVR
jgi:hypothetical protein